MNRKLIRPKLAELKSRVSARTDNTTLTAPAASRRKQVPPEQTNAEYYYYLKQMASKTPMIVIMHDGEVLNGIIEWYDKDCIKLNRFGEPNLLLMKRYIKYIYKEKEKRG